MKVSEVKIKDLMDYIRPDEYDEAGFENILSAVKGFIKSYTGLDDEQIDEHEEFYIAVMILAADMYDNGALYVNTSNLNKTVETILNMHSVNLL